MGGPGERDGKEYARNQCLTPLNVYRLKPGGYGPGCGAQPDRTVISGSGGNSWAACGCRPGGHGEGLRRSRGDAAGTKLGTSPVERTAVNMGTVPVLPPVRAPARTVGLGPPSADRAGTGRSRRSSPRPGKPATWRRAAAETRREGCCNAERRAGEYRRRLADLRAALRRVRRCRPSFTVGRWPILAAGSMICSTSCTTRRCCGWRGTGSRATPVRELPASTG